MPQLNAISNEIIIVKEPTDELHLVDPEVEEETRVQSGRLFFFFWVSSIFLLCGVVCHFFFTFCAFR